ncbi:DUF7667 family protein [Paenibacillus ginsengarvi]|uniref:Uncharacterized protein n=1 Tax=Paenibacillus ginsengarvi TaxID=400777 RepID=A0A3B0CYU9_9BACL|nr:hypothetical protein [Paenibacillus ginsengarvi]RKN86786.1 hypothetical protein D7M11_02170 [Paenibacillus ginsengarvi]
MSTVDQRLLEIIGIMLEKRELTPMEAHELRESHRFIVDRERKRARLLNLLFAARIGKDWIWFEKLTNEYNAFNKLY